MGQDPVKRRDHNRDYMRIWSKLPENQEKCRRWYADNAERLNAKRKIHLAENGDLIRAQQKRWRDKNPEKVVARNKKYKAENWAKVLAYQNLYRAKKRSISIIRHKPEDVYRVVSKAVSSALPRFMRDDVISSMLLAVLEGKLLLGNVGARVKDYLAGYNRQYDSFKTLSLEAPMGGTDLRRIDLLEAPEAYDDEEEEDPDILMLKGNHFRL